MRVVGDLLDPTRRSDRVALRQPGRTPATVEYDRLCVQSWKVAHLFRHQGAGPDAVVGIAAEPTRETVLAVLGSALLGAAVRFLDDPNDPWDASDPPDILVAPTAAQPSRAAEPGIGRVAYGNPPSDPSVTHLHRDAWSENPVPPPETVEPETVFLDGSTASYDHRSVLEAASRVVGDLPLRPTETIAVRSSLTHPGTVVAGIVAPLLVGGAIGLPDGSTVADAAVTATEDDTSGEPRVVDPATVI